MPTVEGKAYWCAITRPNTTFDPVYQVDLAIDDATAKDFTSRGVTVKTDDRGNIIKLKRKVERNDSNSCDGGETILRKNFFRSNLGRYR